MRGSKKLLFFLKREFKLKKNNYTFWKVLDKFLIK